MTRTVFLGTYTNGDSKGIYSCRFDPDTGTLGDLRLAAETVNPSFLALHPNGKFLYAVNETRSYQGTDSGSVTAYAITDAEVGELKPLNTVSSHGGSPCHLVASPGGKSLFIANYHGATVGVLELKPDGSLGRTLGVMRHEGSSVKKPRQDVPHPHAVNLDPAGKHLFVADLGMDEIVKYVLRDDGSLEVTGEGTKVSPGSGPRHFAFRPDGRFGYVINEITRTITAFSYDPEPGILKEIQTISTVPEGWEKGSTAELVAHPGGRFLYGSNRGHDSIAAYAIAPDTGRLTLVEIEKTGGQSPRNFNLDPSGSFLIAANRNTSDIHVFSVDPESGALEPEAGRLEVPHPVCVLFL